MTLSVRLKLFIGSMAAAALAVLTMAALVPWQLRVQERESIQRRLADESKLIADLLGSAQALQRLREGLWVMIFPEGTRMPPGETRKYGVSGALLARESGCLVVPIAHDAGYYWPRRGLLKKRGTITVVIGKPIDPAGRDPRAVNEEAQAWIEGTIRRLQSRDKSLEA